MESAPKKIFISHIAAEHPDASKAKDVLQKTFGQSIIGG
jgi:hypothetical protein